MITKEKLKQTIELIIEVNGSLTLSYVPSSDLKNPKGPYGWYYGGSNKIEISREFYRAGQKIKFDKLRLSISDKIWFDSLSMDEKESVHSNWYFTYPNFTDRTKWSFVTWSSGHDNAPLEGEKIEQYCKRMTPGCKNTQRDLKLNKLLSLK
jgi:hypothetical protein